MEILELEPQIIEILEKKYGHTIDKDDPLMLTITAQALVTEHILELHKDNLESEFELFKEDLTDILKSTRVDSDESRKIISEHVRKTFLNLSDTYKNQLDPEFIKAGQEYQKAKKWYKKTKIWAIGAICISILFFVASFIIN